MEERQIISTLRVPECRRQLGPDVHTMQVLVGAIENPI